MAINSQMGNFLPLQASIHNDKKLNHYLESSIDNPILKMVKSQNGGTNNINILYNIEENICFQIVKRLENALFPCPNKIVVNGINGSLDKILDNQYNDNMTYTPIFKEIGNNFFLFKKGRSFNIDEVRNYISKEIIKDNEKFNILQVIGDCERFSFGGTQFAKKLLTDIVNKKNIVIEWGLTGYDNIEKECYDVNYLTSDIIDSLDVPCIANIVDYHTVEAIQKWGCSISRRCCNFLLYYNNKDCRFGDDVYISDTLCDDIICFEGGAQSFIQCINGLLLGKKILGISGIRDNLKEDSVKYFSCVEFLDLIKRNIKSMNIDIIKELYLDSCLLFNPNKGDAGEKNRLFQEGWDKLVKYKLYNHLDELYFSVKF